MKIILAGSAGFCFGVRRAVRLCRECADAAPGRCVTLGPIIHNKSVTGELASKGVVELGGVGDVMPGDTVVIRSHGATKSDVEALASRGVSVVDATCPDVAKIHEIVREQSRQGRQIILIGQRDHPEIGAISSWCTDCRIFETPDELHRWLTENPQREGPEVAVVFQTTNTRDVLEKCSEIVKKEYTNPKIFDTICNATSRRQEEAKEISRVVDAMIVVGGKSSANSRKLAEICTIHCSRVFFVESADDLDISELREADTVGITAGASTPAWIIKEVCHMLSEELNLEEINGQAEVPAMEDRQAEERAPVEPVTTNMESEAPPAVEPFAQDDEPLPAEEAVDAEAAQDDQAQEEPAQEEPAQEDQDDQAETAETFAEMLEKSIKTLNTGEKVTGVVAAITPTEISVDLGTKQSGYIPLAEFTDDPTVKIEEVLQVGDTIETFVMRVNDVEGTVMLSKKRLDSVRNWEDIEIAKNEKTIVEGNVTEENKGGVVVSVRGVRVFVPASQTGLPKDVPMTSLVKTKVRLRITEVNQSRRRVVGSIRAVLNEERRAKIDQIWAEIEPGKKYTGTVKSMTSYGAFVDIGGIDGMVHVSELSWTRINQPSDILKIGDEIEVYVISFDREKRKISLGYKTMEDNPWEKFITAHQIGDTVNVRIVKLMPFGAFAEILPGVDGLIHISQITDHRIGFPSEVLSEGMTADVKITDIDMDKHKVSLSIRALMEPAPMPFSMNRNDRRPTIVYDTDAPPMDNMDMDDE